MPDTSPQIHLLSSFASAWKLYHNFETSQKMKENWKTYVKLRNSARDLINSDKAWLWSLWRFADFSCSLCSSRYCTSPSFGTMFRNSFVKVRAVYFRLHSGHSIFLDLWIKRRHFYKPLSNLFICLTSFSIREDTTCGIWFFNTFHDMNLKIVSYYLWYAWPHFKEQNSSSSPSS